MSKKIVIAKILTAHGVKGFVKLESFMEKAKDIFNYSENLYSDNGKNFKIKFIGKSKDNVFITQVEGINSPEAAKSWRNTELYIDINLLPESEDGDYYYNELIGLEANSTDNKSKGKIISVDDFGAGIVVEIKWDDEKMTETLPFIEDYFKEIDTKKGKILVERPEYV